MLIGLQYRILRKAFPRTPNSAATSSYERDSKLETLVGSEFFNQISGRVVTDFGCGEGSDVIEVARKGARRAIGIDIREGALEIAKQKARAAGVEEICLFALSTNELSDIIFSVDAFEHFGDPAAILEMMNALLGPRGEVVISW